MTGLVRQHPNVTSLAKPAAARLETVMARVFNDPEQSVRTQEAYRSDIQHFAAFLGFFQPLSKSPDRRLKPRGDSVQAAQYLFSLRKEEAQVVVGDYLDHMKTAGLAPATRNRRLSAIKKLAVIGCSAGLISWVLDIAATDGHRTVKTNLKGPSFDDLLKVLSAAKTLADSGRPEPTRNYAILRMMADLGIRRGPISSLYLKHLDTATKTVTLCLKGGRNGTFELPSLTWQALQSWLVVRGSTPGPVFIGLTNRGQLPGDSTRWRPLTGKAVFALVRAAGQRVGLNLHPHSIRHTTVTDVIKHEGLLAAQTFARHERAETTQRYFDEKEQVGNQATAALARRYEARMGKATSGERT